MNGVYMKLLRSFVCMRAALKLGYLEKKNCLSTVAQQQS